MALIVRQNNTHVGHRDFMSGEIIPKEYEVDPTHDFSSAISVGRVDRLPDQAFYEVPNESFFESVEPARKISKLLSDYDYDSLIDEVAKISDQNFLDVMLRREKNNLNREWVIDIIEDRQDELLNELSGEE